MSFAVNCVVECKAVIYQGESGMYVAYSPSLDVFSQGKTSEDAKKSIMGAVMLMLPLYLLQGKFLPKTRFNGTDVRICLSKEKLKKKLKIPSQKITFYFSIEFSLNPVIASK